jgi:ribose transport system permease protein
MPVDLKPVVAKAEGRQTGASSVGRVTHVDVLLRIVRMGPAGILLTLVCAASLASPAFLTESNVQNVLVQSAVTAMLGIGQLLAILTAGIDLSVGSVLGLSSTIGGLMSTSSALDSGALMLVGMALSGLIVGLANGLLYVRGRVSHPFIVTFVMLTVVRGVEELVSNGQQYPLSTPAVIKAGQGFVGPVPVPALIVASAAFVTYLFTKHTRWGRWIYAVGANPEGAKKVGIPVGKVLVSVYALSGLTAAIGGIITAGQTATGDPTAGTGAELNAIAAVIIGGASFTGGRGGVANVLVGALTIGVIGNALDLLNVSAFLQMIAVGAVVLCAVELDVIRTWLERRLRVTRSEDAK